MTSNQCKDYPLVAAVFQEPVDRLCRPLASFEEYAALESALRIRDSRIGELEKELSELEDAATYCIGKGRLDDALQEWRTLNKS